MFGNILSTIKYMQGIEKVLWSEQIYNVPASKENIKAFKNIGLKIIKLEYLGFTFHLLC